MSSRENRDAQPSMLILSRAVYARRSDDAFYPATIETKQPDGSYLVKFADGTSERVVEHNITWLGFWGLPPWTWPRNPVVQTAGPANMDFLNGLIRNDNRKEHVAGSVPLNTLFREGSDTSKRVNGFSGVDIKSDVPTRAERMTDGRAEELDAFEDRAAHVLPRQSTENQARISVLRMCCTDENLRREPNRTEKELSSKEDKLESPVFNCSPHSASPNDEDHQRHFTFDDVCKIFKVKNDTSVRKRKISASDYEEDSMREKYRRSEDIENRLQNSPSVQKHYPTPIPPLLSPRYQNYGHPFGISMYDASSPPLPASFRLQNRARRRSENKKCRKVYGIENRDIWCTQCKWKKACTRFTNNDKGDRPEMAFLADYAGLQYPA